MNPALGTFKPETRHLNFKWTIELADKALKLAAHRMSADEICVWFKRNHDIDCTRAEIVDLCFGAGHFVRHRTALYRRQEEWK